MKSGIPEQTEKRKVIDFADFIEKIKGTPIDDGYIVTQIAEDVEELGETVATHYVMNFSPSKLGVLGYLGLRKMSQLKRDNQKMFYALVKFKEE